MRKVTVCETGPAQLVPGADHKYKYSKHKMLPGTAWRIDDDTRDHHIVSVDQNMCDHAKYTWRLRWIDGRSVAVFEVGSQEFAQPTVEDPRAKATALGSQRKRALRRVRREAPGVAPEVPVADEPKPRRKKVIALDGDGKPRRKRHKFGPRNGLALVD